jgi:hypothetical protein
MSITKTSGDASDAALDRQGEDLGTAMPSSVTGDNIKDWAAVL